MHLNPYFILRQYAQNRCSTFSKGELLLLNKNNNKECESLLRLGELQLDIAEDSTKVIANNKSTKQK